MCLPTGLSLHRDVSVPSYAQGRPLWGHSAPAQADCRSLKLCGERQAAWLDFDFNRLLVSSSLFARGEEPSTGKQGLCPLLGPAGGHHQCIFPSGGHRETARSKARSLACSGHQEMLRATPFSKCCLSPPATPGRMQRGGGDSSKSTCPVALWGSLPAPALPSWMVCFL